MPKGDFRPQKYRRPQKHVRKHLTILEEAERAMKLRQAERRIDAAIEVVRQRRRELGELLLQLQAEGLPIAEQARILGTSRTMIYKWTVEAETEASNARTGDRRRDRRFRSVSSSDLDFDLGSVRDVRAGDGNGDGDLLDRGEPPVEANGRGGNR